MVGEETALSEDRPITDLVGRDRELAVPVIIDSFTGIYRWHAKRTLRDVSTVRGVHSDGALAGVSMLEQLVPGVGYVYYIAVGRAHRRQGVGGRLLDDALSVFLKAGDRIAYAAVEADNHASLELFRSRGFRPVRADEPNYKDGGLGAWGLRSRMRVVWGEVLLGRHLVGDAAGTPTSPTTDGRTERG